MIFPIAPFAELTVPTATTHQLFAQLGISVLLGLLVGLQRQHAAAESESDQPGMRTFPLITVLGTLCGILAQSFDGWIIVAGLLALAVVMGLTNLLRMRQEEPDPSTTTNMAMLVMFGVGVLLTVKPAEIAIAVGGGVAVLLHLKSALHRFVQQLGREDLQAIMQFVLITCIVLQVLPNRTYDPLGVLNPFVTWLIVVLIVGMSLGGYLFYKFIGRDAGTLLGGVLGGIISSTATTVSYSRQARNEPSDVRSLAVVIMIASTVALVRVAAAVAVVSPEFFLSAAGPMTTLLTLTFLPSLALWFWVRHNSPATPPAPKNPTQLKSAITFAVIYSVVLLALAATKQYLHGRGMLMVAGVSGLSDMDAITLSTARMARDDATIISTAWRLIVMAAVANLFAKTVLAGIMGGRRMLMEMAFWFALPFVGGILILILWQ